MESINHVPGLKLTYIFENESFTDGLTGNTPADGFCGPVADKTVEAVSLG
jgi:hypothetical protein